MPAREVTRQQRIAQGHAGVDRAFRALAEPEDWVSRRTCELGVLAMRLLHLCAGVLGRRDALGAAFFANRPLGRRRLCHTTEVLRQRVLLLQFPLGQAPAALPAFLYRARLIRGERLNAPLRADAILGPARFPVLVVRYPAE